MDKIPFEDGTLVKAGYVEIDGVKYEVIPAEYTGETPLSAYNMKKLQDNVEEATMIGRISLQGNSIQEGTPSIDSEAPIKSVGDNINLFNKDTVTSGGLSTTTGNVISNSSWRNSEYISVDSKTTYCFSWESDNNYFQATVCYYDSDKNFISGLSLNKNTAYSNMFETVEGTCYVRVSYSFNVSGTNVTRYNIKLEKGTKATPYSPYRQGSIEIKQVNKNFFDGIAEQGALNADGWTADSTTRVRMNKRVFLKKGSYTINANGSEQVAVYFYNDTTAKAESNSGWVNTPYTFTITTDKYVYGAFRKADSSAVTINNINNIQIEEGIKQTDYVPHQSQTKALYTQQPFRAIGDYKDKFVKKLGKWNEEHKIREIPLANRSGWLSGANYFALPIGGLNYGTYDDKISPVLSSTHFKYVSGKPVNSLQEGEMWYQTLSNNLSFKYIYFGVDKTKDYASTLEKFEQWLLNNNVLLNYVLATPTLIPCTAEQVEVLSDINGAYGEGMTNIICNDEIEPVIEIVKESKETVQSENDKAISALLARIEALEKALIS